VVVVTAWLDGRAWGMTVTACCSISAAPPRVLVSLRSDTRSRALICERGAFGVSILGSRHKAVAELAARTGSPKFVDAYCGEAESANAQPRIEAALSHLECRLATTFEVGDHTLVVGEVESAVIAPAADPLVYFDRAYRRLGGTV
jgi:flavin reductase (DIM6/NTAB) family NADH-FMN oxidoreductase RutF